MDNDLFFFFFYDSENSRLAEAPGAYWASTVSVVLCPELKFIFYSGKFMEVTILHRDSKHRDSWIQIPVSRFTNCVILGKVLNLSGPQIFNLQDVYIHRTYLNGYYDHKWFNISETLGVIPDSKWISIDVSYSYCSQYYITFCFLFNILGRTPIHIKKKNLAN